MSWKSKKITITLDCCRGPATLTRTPEALSTTFGGASSVTNLDKIFILYATPEMHTSSDDNSLTKELYKVTEKGRKPMSILELAEEINNSWRERMKEGNMQVPVVCKDDMIKVERNWKDFACPEEYEIWASQEEEEETTHREPEMHVVMSEDTGNKIEQEPMHAIDPDQELEKGKKNRKGKNRNTEKVNEDEEESERVEKQKGNCDENENEGEGNDEGEDVEKGEELEKGDEAEEKERDMEKGKVKEKDKADKKKTIVHTKSSSCSTSNENADSEIREIKLRKMLADKFGEVEISETKLKEADDFMSLPMNWCSETFKHGCNIGLNPENIEEFGSLLVGECGLKRSKKHKKEIFYFLRGLKTVALKKTSMLDCTMYIDEYTFIYGLLAGFRAEGEINVAYAIHTLTFSMTQEKWQKSPKLGTKSKSKSERKFDPKEIQDNYIQHRALKRLKTEGIIRMIKYVE